MSSTQSLSVDGVSHLIMNDVILKCGASKLSEMGEPQFRRLLDGWGIDCDFITPMVVTLPGCFLLKMKIQLTSMSIVKLTLEVMEL